MTNIRRIYGSTALTQTIDVQAKDTPTVKDIIDSMEAVIQTLKDASKLSKIVSVKSGDQVVQFNMEFISDRLKMLADTVDQTALEYIAQRMDEDI